MKDSEHSPMLPGYNSYIESENRRKEDRKAREYLAERLQECKGDLQSYVKARLAVGDLDSVLSGEKLREQINHIQSKTLAAFEGYSAKFESRKVDAEVLKRIADFDSDLVAVVDRLQQQILRRDTAHQEVVSAETMLDFEKASQWVSMYLDRFDKRNQLLAK
ncbi:MAG: hypothetical protein NTW52_17805 [Planctomycetota bacterium]|nr:hypothetical protein [Planctomycetota bacterium]